jgi:quercetin dioxygenase-like cupin family protein
MAQRPYSPSPRPNFEVPTAIYRRDVTRHIWGDDQAGEVADWIYASTARVHCLLFGLPPGGRFVHSPEFRTVFGADEVLQVISGTAMVANPETGEVYKVEQGEWFTFGANTWHHVFTHGTKALRVLEFLAPPPASGSTGRYARTRPYLEAPRYAVPGDIAGEESAERPEPSIRVVRDKDLIWQLRLGVPTGIVASTGELTVMHVEIDPGQVSTTHSHGGDELLFVAEGVLHVRAWQGDQAYVFELGPEDACLIPAGAEHEYRNYGSDQVSFVLGVAPQWHP